MKVHQIMTAHARCVGPDNTLVEAAGLMRELDVGVVPVCDNEALIGIVTDRDIVLRGTADGRDPNTTTVRDVMSEGVVHVLAEQEVEEAARLMEERQVRRLPVLGSDRRLVGIVSLGDIAMSSTPAFSGMALRDVSAPRDPSARQRRLAEQSEPRQHPRATPPGPDAATEKSEPRRASRTSSAQRRSPGKKKMPAAARRQKPAPKVSKKKGRSTVRKAGRRTSR